MKDTITYRPTIVPEKLTEIIRKLHYPKVNRFIDEAVREKISREANDPKGARRKLSFGRLWNCWTSTRELSF